ncbi:MAG: dihydrodipicolinate synthase family protein [Alphaproteobacteria bacterium]|nr:dihydrodipicolinate synthase family protein [Alphaproteobacteria bacterium]
MKFSGINAIISTPFTNGEEVDYESLCNLIDKIVCKGVHAITILGVASEAQKLSAQERSEIAAKAFETVAGRCPVVVTTSGNDTDAVVSASLAAERAGAAAVMVAPPKGLKFSPELVEHYSKIAQAISIPIVLQDLAEATGVDLSPRAMSELLKAVPQITAIKLETPPTPLRISETRKLVSDEIAILGGNGGVHFLNELRRGANGAMTGFAYTEALLQIWNYWNIGNRAAAAKSYLEILPLLVFEFQPKIGVAIRKEILKRRGLIKTAVLRGVPEGLSPEMLSDLSETLVDLGVQERYDDRRREEISEPVLVS